MIAATNFKLLMRLWRHTGKMRHRQIWGLMTLMLISSFMEVISIGSVLPFLGVLTAPERIFLHPAAQTFILAFGLTSADQLLFPVTVIFCCFAIIAAIVRLLLLWVSTRLSFAIGADLSIKIYRKTLYQPYSIHCERNSSEVINGVSNKTNIVINAVIVPALTLFNSAIMLVTILLALFIVLPGVSLTVFGGFGFIYLIIIVLTRKKLLFNSNKIANESTLVLKALQEGLGGIRDVLISGTQEFYCKIYRKSDLNLRRAQADNLFIGSFPKHGIESLGLVLIAVVAYFLTQGANSIGSAIPTLGAVALGAQRLLPVLQQLYNSWSAILGSQSSLDDTLKLLDQPLPQHLFNVKGAHLTFKNTLSLKKINFRYNDNSPFLFKEFNLTIKKGSRIGFIGETGSGKSTLLDIIMGIQKPFQGTLEIDGEVINSSNIVSWQKNIAHVPQVIYLADISIAENIAFGVPIEQIDFERVILAAEQAQIADTISTWPDKYHTVVGERGVRLSGGQRQRIGIARALYKQADIIVFDEATSALDSATEKVVMNAINNLSSNLTLIIVAHRITTLEGCDTIVKLSKIGMVTVGKYNDIMSI